MARSPLLRSTWPAIGLLMLAALGSACDSRTPPPPDKSPPATTPGGTATTPMPPASAASK
jgi:hypothetical protein